LEIYVPKLTSFESYIPKYSENNFVSLRSLGNNRENLKNNIRMKIILEEGKTLV
jgi:hypothetical protein